MCTMPIPLTRAQERLEHLLESERTSTQVRTMAALAVKNLKQMDSVRLVGRGVFG